MSKAGLLIFLAKYPNFPIPPLSATPFRQMLGHIPGTVILDCILSKFIPNLSADLVTP